MSQEPLPYSVSSGSAYNAFKKLQGAKNYVTWKHNMQTVLPRTRRATYGRGDQGAPSVASPRGISLHGNILPGSRLRQIRHGRYQIPQDRMDNP